MTAQKNIELPAVFYGTPPKKRHQKAIDLLAEVGLADRGQHRPPELSGGQQQRVAIARALINSPDIILADEPTGALDSKSGQEIMDIFEKMRKEGKTILMVTHTPEVARIADRIVFMRDGKITDHNYHLPQ